MCGIVGYIGRGNAVPFLLDGLKGLEYRGYDSAGVYVAGKGAIKRAGKVRELELALPKELSGSAGIGHTRWATHGAPSERNAHPHPDAAEAIWLVHNGIIENHREIRARLEDAGVQFRSDTDTEALAQLIGERFAGAQSLEHAVADALSEVTGAYAIAVMSAADPRKIVAARNGSPLLLGIGDTEYYLASDATPLLSRTKQVIYLDDGEMAVITTEGYSVTTREHEPLKKEVQTLTLGVQAVQKQGYEHFMLKEIMEAPQVLENAMRGRIDIACGRVHLAELNGVEDRLRKARRVIITGCGTAYYAGLTGKLLIEEYAGIPAETEVASELRYRNFTANPSDTILIAVSQSGETADTLEAVREAKRHGMLTLAVVNVVGSSIAREADVSIHTLAGPEIGVASTKGFTSQLSVLTLIALYLQQLRVQIEPGVLEELARMPDYARQILSGRERIRGAAASCAEMRDALFIGRKFQYPIAYEGALKLKEISYVHAEAYPAGELKHGPLALIEPGFPVIALMPRDSLYEKTLSNVEEARSRGARIIAVTTGKPSESADETILIPETHEALLPLLTSLPLHLFAYYVAHARGLPIDMPRNLAKSVTVE